MSIFCEYRNIFVNFGILSFFLIVAKIGSRGEGGGGTGTFKLLLRRAILNARRIPLARV